MHHIRRILAFVCCIALLCALALPVLAEENSSYELIQQMLNYYRHHQTAAQTDIFRLVEELEALDPQTGAQWRSIMEYWLYANSELPRNTTEAPTDLPQDDTLCIVVLGYRLTAYGGMFPELEGRLEIARQAAEQYPNAWILCTGGGTASEEPDVTEAGQMARWLRKQGIESDRIILEDNSTHTVENAKYAFDIISARYPQIRQLILVTSDYHLPRSSTLFHAKAVLTAGKLGTEPITVAACLGYDADHEGTAEDPLDQTAHLARVAGFEYERRDVPPLSQLTDLTVTGQEIWEVGQIPEFTVTAHYDSGYSRDVTGDCHISDYEPMSTRSQELSVTYAENGRQITASLLIRRPAIETQAPAPTETEAATPTEPMQALPDIRPSIPWIPILAAAGLVLLLAVLLILKRKK